MSIVFNQYEERLRRRKRKPATIKSFMTAADRISEYFAEHDIDPLTVDALTIEDYFADSPYAATTKKVHLDYIGAAYRYALRRGTVATDPTVDVELEKVPDKQPRIIPNARLREMKEQAVTDRAWMLFHVLAYTGMRRTEARCLKWDDVSLEDHTIAVVGKGDKLRHIPIHPALGEAFVDHRLRVKGEYVFSGRRGAVMSDHTMWDILHCLTGGDYTTHDFRRTVASSLFENDVNSDLIDEIMGWAKIGIRRKHYQAIAPAKLQLAILRLYRNDPI